MTVKFKTVITKAGAEKLAAATVPNGKKVNFTAMAVGDGGGQLPTPNATQTKLVNEVWRHALNKISQDHKNKNYVIAELLIPPETGGFWMREMGLYDDAGTLIAVGNMAESYKPTLAEGSGRAQTVRMVIMVSDINTVELTIDTTTVMASQDYVDGKLAEHEQSRRHPDATLTAKGFTQLSNATDSASEVLAATPKAVKAVNDDLNTVKRNLGTAATADIATSDTDTTAKRLLPVGWMGLGALSGVTFTDANTPNFNCYFRMNAQGIHGPVFNAPANIHQFQYDTNAGQQIGYRAGVVDAAMYHRSKVNGTWGSWSQVFDTEHPPTAKQVGALPYSGRLLNSIYDLTVSDVLVALGNGTSTPTAGMPDNSSNTRFAVYANQIYDGQFWVCLVSRDQNYTGLVNTSNKTVSWAQVYNTSNKPTASDVDAVSANNGGTFKKEVAFPSGLNVRSSTGIYSGNDAAGFTSNNMLLKSWYGIGFYCTLAGAEGVTGYINTRNGQLEMKGQIIPGNYTNFDARYNFKNTASKAASGWEKDNSTGVIKQWGIATRGADSTRITFPTAFPNACISVQLTLVWGGSFHDQNIYVQNPDKSGFTYVAGSGEVRAYFEARGY